MESFFPALPQWIKDINIGIIALLANIIVAVYCKLVYKRISIK
jgi:hypothetical protein